MVQPVDQGRIASFKVQYKKKLLEWVLSQFDSSTTHEDLRKILLKACYYVVLSSVERDKSPNHMKQLEVVQDFTCKLEC